MIYSRCQNAPLPLTKLQWIGPDLPCTLHSHILSSAQLPPSRPGETETFSASGLIPLSPLSSRLEEREGRRSPPPCWVTISMPSWGLSALPLLPAATPGLKSHLHLPEESGPGSVSSSPSASARRHCPCELDKPCDLPAT